MAAKNTVSSEVLVAPEAAIPLTLVEFCSRLSLKDGRVEMIGAFEHDERTSGVVKDTEVAFSKRYAEFVSKAV